MAAQSKNKSVVRSDWHEEANQFIESYQAQIGTSVAQVSQIKRNNLHMVNPQACFWRKQQGHQYSNQIDYDSGYVSTLSDDFISDSDWEAVLEPENLLLAWARVRNALEFEMLEDTVEIRLFDVNVEERLSKLRDEIFSYEWSALSIQDAVHFAVPKGEGKPSRPMSLCRLEDQILSTAFIQVKERNYKRNASRVFSHTIARRKGESLYQHWFPAHQSYIEAARAVARKNPTRTVIKTDLSSYYTSIVQSNLLGELRHNLRLYESRNEDIANRIINRDCGLGKNGIGIPQGHIASGLFANIYLDKIDSLFTQGHLQGMEYFRFVDDIILIVPPSTDTTETLKTLDNELSMLGLTRSAAKTEILTSQQFLDTTEQDGILQNLSKKHEAVLKDLYRLDNAYIKLPFVSIMSETASTTNLVYNTPKESRRCHTSNRSRSARTDH